jgi:hypothetical protein
MDPVTFIIMLFTQTTFGLPLVILAIATAVWALASPTVYPPAMNPTAVPRDIPPDAVSTIYWTMAAGQFATPMGFAYHRFVAATRERYGIAPWEVPWRKSKCRKLGIERPKAITKLEKDFLDLYNQALVLDAGRANALVGARIWNRRVAKFKKMSDRVLGTLQEEMPELWSN